MRTLLNLDAVAAYLGLPLEDVQGLIEADKLHAIEVLPGVLRIHPTDLQQFIEARRRAFQSRLEHA